MLIAQAAGRNGLPWTDAPAYSASSSGTKKKPVLYRRHLVAVIKILGFVNRPLDTAAFVAAVASVATVFVAVAVVVVVGVREDDILRFWIVRTERILFGDELPEMSFNFLTLSPMMAVNKLEWLPLDNGGIHLGMSCSVLNEAKQNE